MHSGMGFDLAFGGYTDVPPTMGKVVAERLIAYRYIDNTTGEVGNNNNHTIYIVTKSELIDLEIEKCNESNFKFEDYESQ